MGLSPGRSDGPSTDSSGSVKMQLDGEAWQLHGESRNPDGILSRTPSCSHPNTPHCWGFCHVSAMFRGEMESKHVPWCLEFCTLQYCWTPLDPNVSELSPELTDSVVRRPVIYVSLPKWTMTVRSVQMIRNHWGYGDHKPVKEQGFKMRLEAISTRVEAIASRLEAIASTASRCIWPVIGSSGSPQLLVRLALEDSDFRQEQQCHRGRGPMVRNDATGVQQAW